MTTELSATVLRLPDARDLSFAEYGDPDGIPVFGFHGTPGSRRQMAPIEGMMGSNRLLTRVGRRSPALMGFAMRLVVAAMRRFAGRFFESFIKVLPEPDQELMRRPAVRKAFSDDFRSMPRTGGRAAAQDFEIFAGDWGFRLEDIRIPVHFWQGDLDRNVPPQHVHVLAGPMPRAVIHDCPGEGHLLVLERLDEILTVASGKES